MKRILIVLLIMMLTKITCFSSNTSIITEKDSTVRLKISDLKYANLIFVEHDKLLKENHLLNQQLKNYSDLNNELTRIDSLRVEQINKLNKSYTTKINSLNKEINKKNSAIKYWQIGGITVSVGLILFILFK